MPIRHGEVPDQDCGRYGGTGEFNVGVRFHGMLQSAPVPRNCVAMQFNKSETPTFGNYARCEGIRLQACHLMVGAWSVTTEVISVS